MLISGTLFLHMQKAKFSHDVAQMVVDARGHQKSIDLTEFWDIVGFNSNRGTIFGTMLGYKHHKFTYLLTLFQT